MKNIETRMLILIPVSLEHLSILTDWRNSSDFLKFCTSRQNKLTPEEFERELRRDFSFDRHAQYIAFERVGKQPVGTVYSYNFNQVDGNVFVSTYLSPDKRGRVYGFEMVTAFCIWLFEKYHFLHKIYMDVYEYNHVSITTLKKAGFSEEGRFKEHHLFDAKRWDMIRLAFYRSQLENIEKLTKRVRPVD